jgi:plasmid stabilization system protein ParE
MADRRPPIIWSSDALADLSDIWDYYANVAGRHTADKIVREIGEACRILEDHPFPDAAEMRYGRVYARSLRVRTSFSIE